MPNTIEVLTFVTREMLRQVKNNLQFVRNVSGEEFAGRFTEAPKKGETIKIRKPTRYIGRDGETFTAEDYIERVVEMTVQQTAGVDIELTQRELMFRLDDIAERVVKPAAQTLANKIDRAALLIATQAVANSVGTAGTIPSALKLYNQARAKMSWDGAPQDGSHAQLLTPDMQVEIADAIKALHHDQTQINKAFRMGLLTNALGSDWYECQNLITHTVGPLGGTPLVNGASQTGASLITDGWTAAAALRLNKGDVFTVGVNAANPWTRQSTGAVRQFVATANVNSDATGAATIPISPSIVTTGPFQNVTGSPADNAAITVLGAAAAVSPQGLRFHREAFLFGTFDQPKPEGAVEFVSSVSDSQTGIKIRFIRDWDTKANKQINRFDCVWAFGVAFPEFATRIFS